MKNYNNWKEVALYCEEIFGVQVDLEEGFFICPECGDPIYYDDWKELSHFWICPICEIDFNTGEYCKEEEEEE